MPGKPQPTALRRVRQKRISECGQSAVPLSGTAGDQAPGPHAGKAANCAGTVDKWNGSRDWFQTTGNQKVSAGIHSRRLASNWPGLGTVTFETLAFGRRAGFAVSECPVLPQVSSAPWRAVGLPMGCPASSHQTQSSLDFPRRSGPPRHGRWPRRRATPFLSTCPRLRESRRAARPR